MTMIIELLHPRHPRGAQAAALYMRVMFAAAFDGLRVGQVRHGGPDLPRSPWPRREHCGQCGWSGAAGDYHRCPGLPGENQF